ncbi:MAG: tRNA (adenosine(37)-N6)-dimethylallyltransferase MiaA [Lachnospiraceae bacterium]|nr:tRNA (adenosine(37)-N6)-dimethylallyltransferase MiaA [Lachnospiraceae bacterium]
MKPLVIIAGPTAIGKTLVSIELAKRVNGEIISADSMQVYRGMDIGTAKIKNEEMQGITHYMIDIMEPYDTFNVSVFKNYAKECINRIYDKNKLPIIVGGTGFYIQAVLYDIDFKEYDEDKALKIRQKYEALSQERGIDFVYEYLQSMDPDAAALIPKQNKKRVIRAIEYYELTGEKISVHNKKEREKKSLYNDAYFVLTDRREKIYENIDKRVDIMMKEGLLSEVRGLYEGGISESSTAMQGLGYKQLYKYLKGEYDLDTAVYKIKQETRHFAKRQLTWFKREKNAIMLDKNSFKDDTAGILDEMLIILKEKGIFDGA